MTAGPLGGVEPRNNDVQCRRCDTWWPPRLIAVHLFTSHEIGDEPDLRLRIEYLESRSRTDDRIEAIVRRAHSPIRRTPARPRRRALAVVTPIRSDR